jgi:hypothetical protein
MFADWQQARRCVADWLLGMRNTDMHRGQRIVTWSANSDGNEITDFTTCRSSAT